MKLPTMETPTYKLKLIGSGEEVSFTPYTVKQEKILLIALESTDVQQIVDAIFSVIEQCIDGLDVRSLPQYELENIFLNLRAKSVGETVNLSLKCEECNHVNPHSVDLLKYTLKGEVVDPKIQLNEEMGVMMKHPSIDQLKEFIVTDQSNAELMIKVVGRCIDYIYDENQIYPAAEVGEEQLISFIESLSTSQYREMLKYVDNAPKLTQDISFDCEGCGKHNDIVLEGLQSFFM